jgi:arylsulfatase A-like enzyme
VPLLIKIPGGGGEKIKKKVSLIDLTPTLCHLAGVKPDLSFKGKNLFNSPTFPLFHQAAPHISDNQATPELLEKKLSKYNVAYQDNEWKYILNKINQTEELYNLSKDSKEKVNLSGEKPEVLSQMRKNVEKFERENPPLSLLGK